MIINTCFANHWMQIEHWLQITAGVAALIAAVIWLRASRVKFPRLPASPQNIDASYGGAARQCRLNAWAAGWTALVALIQFLLALVPICSGGMVG